jgi:hypothetical protein
MGIVRILFLGWGAKHLLINLNVISLRIILLIGLQCSGHNNDFLKYFRIFFFSDFLLKILEGHVGARII